MTLVLLVLAAVWAAVLIPPALRARQEGRPSDSISNFRRQLAVLRRTGPRSERMSPDVWSRPPMAAPLATVSRIHPHAMPVARPRPPYATGGRPVSSSRSRTLQRRRDVLTALVATVAATLVLGAIPALRALWAVHLLADVLLVAYVALLIRQRNMAAERDLKVRFLPETTRFEPGLVTREPALLRRSAN